MSYRFWLATVLMLAALVLGVPALSAQQPSPWQAVVYTETYGVDYATGEVLYIGDTGIIDRTPLSIDALFGNSLALDALLSPDARYLVLARTTTTSNQIVPPLHIIDLAENTTDYLYQPAQPATYDLGEFSPDGTQFAVSYINFNDISTYDFAGGLMIVDPATGEVVTDVAWPQVISVGGAEDFSAWGILGDWEADGVRYLPFCYACDGFLRGEVGIWNPVTNQFTRQSGEYFDIIADELPGTGEVVYQYLDPRFPQNPDNEFFPYPTSNVVRHSAEGTPNTGSEVAGPAIYFDSADASIYGSAHWITNGTAIIVTDTSGTWTIVRRDASTQPVPMPADARFVIGTPDGWLATVPDPTSGGPGPFGAPRTALVQYRPVANGVVEETVLVEGGLDAVFGLNVTPELGTGGPFDPFIAIDPATVIAPVVTSIAPPAPTVPAVQVVPGCETSIPSRLPAGTLARVVPGDPNRLRADPNTSATILGQIPGGASFTVIGGPVCTEGITWVQVDYNGTIGWTAEGQGGTYFIEPAS